MDSNLKIYNQSKTVPENAMKTIEGGNLKGFTDINTMWRIKKLTELFGVCGFGWYYEIVRTWKEEDLPDDSCRVFCEVALYIKIKDQWSKPILGTGGNRLYYSSRAGATVTDDCYKMALSDALSICCKSLGIGANVYYKEDKTKYSCTNEDNKKINSNKEISKKEDEIYKCNNCNKAFTPTKNKNGQFYSSKDIYEYAKLKNPDGVARCKKCLNQVIKNYNKVYYCVTCSKPFKATKSKKGKFYSSKDVYEYAKLKNPDGVARCKKCLTDFLDDEKENVIDEYFYY